jgi:pimeloyl-ACP methyl ester carboxylesterase
VVITGSGYSFDWGLVQSQVAKFTQVCAYDHSGIAWSDPGPLDTCSLRVAEINAALRKAGIAGPYVLVGHSLGALVARLYASRYPDEVAGMVIADHAASFTHGEKLGPKLVIRQPAQPSGKPADPNAGFDKLPERDYRLHVWANSLPGRSQVMKRNFEMAGECSRDVEAATANVVNPLGDKPFIALSHSLAQELHTQLLSLSTNGRQVIAGNSGHYVMVDRPDAVIGAIREVVEAARNHTGLKD